MDIIKLLKPDFNQEPDLEAPGWSKSCTCRSVEALGEIEGEEYGLAESISRTLARILLLQGRQRFGQESANYRVLLHDYGTSFARESLEQLSKNLVTATDWDSWLKDCPPPPDPPKVPDYTLESDDELDFEPSTDSIDTYSQMPWFGMGMRTIHLRIQKWYQPDLDRVLYEDSCKYERMHGTMPVVVVILMWPPAEGEGMTGRFEDRDDKGKLKRVFTYSIARAWEKKPEEVVQSAGTMILAPFTAGAKGRMKEVMSMVRKGLQELNADDKTREAVWTTIYWNIGLVCNLKDAHAALGIVLPFIFRCSFYLIAKKGAFSEAYVQTLKDGPAMGLHELILRQGNILFGENPSIDERLDGIEAEEELERLALRVFSSKSWEELFGAQPCNQSNDTPPEPQA